MHSKLIKKNIFLYFFLGMEQIYTRIIYPWLLVFQIGFLSLSLVSFLFRNIASCFRVVVIFNVCMRRCAICIFNENMQIIFIIYEHFILNNTSFFERFNFSNFLCRIIEFKHFLGFFGEFSQATHNQCHIIRNSHNHESSQLYRQCQGTHFYFVLRNKIPLDCLKCTLFFIVASTD